jgi:hypothetical protein
MWFWEWAGMAQQAGAELMVLDDPLSARGITRLRCQRHVDGITCGGEHRGAQQQRQRISRTSRR